MEGALSRSNHFLKAPSWNATCVNLFGDTSCSNNNAWPSFLVFPETQCGPQVWLVLLKTVYTSSEIMQQGRANWQLAFWLGISSKWVCMSGGNPDSTRGNIRVGWGIGKIVQQIKAPAGKCEELSSTPGPLGRKTEVNFWWWSTGLHIHAADAQSHTHTDKLNNEIKWK